MIDRLPEFAKESGRDSSEQENEQRGNCRTCSRPPVDTYGCLPLAFVRGEGSYLYDADGNRYLDFFCGLAVTSLGHSHPGVVRAIQEQAEKLTHVSNVFHTEPRRAPGRALSSRLFGDGRVFFGNSGAEANEAAIKLARNGVTGTARAASRSSRRSDRFTAARWRRSAPPARRNIIRDFCRWCRASSWSTSTMSPRWRSAITDQTVAIMVEPIQGEGGVVVPHPDYLKRLRELCDRAKLLLILDEVQTGMGRTGKFFCYSTPASSRTSSRWRRRSAAGCRSAR